MKNLQDVTGFMIENKSVIKIVTDLENDEI